MKGHVGTTQEQEHWLTRSSVQGITSQLFKQMQRLMSKYVTNVNALAIFPGNHRSISPR